MNNKQEIIACSQLYRHKFKKSSIKRTDDYQQWLMDYVGFVKTLHENITNNVKGVNPDFDTFCRFLYKSCQCNFNPSNVRK